MSEKKGKGSRKIGRNLRKPTCKRYTNTMRWVTNKIRNLEKHIKNHPSDSCAGYALKRLTS